MKNKKFLGLNINILLFGLTSFFNDISSEMILPILPILIKSLGGGAFIIGLAGGLRDSIGSILKLLSGYLADKTKKYKFFVNLGYLTSSIFKVLLYFSQNWQQLLTISSLERIGKGLRDAPRDAIITTITKERGKALGLHKAFDTAGAVIGSILTLILFWLFKLDFKIIIIIAAIISFLSLLPLQYIKLQKTIVKKTAISNNKLSNKLKVFLFISSLFYLSNFSYMFFVLKSQNFFSGKYQTILPLLLYVLYNIFYATFTIPIGILSDKIGRKKIIISTYILFGLINISFIFANNIFIFLLLFAFYGIFSAGLDSNHKAMISDISSENIRATALGLFQTTTGIILLFSSLIAGFLWQTFSSSATFTFSAIISFISVILLIIFYKKI